MSGKRESKPLQIDDDRNMLAASPYKEAGAAGNHATIDNQAEPPAYNAVVIHAAASSSTANTCFVTPGHSAHSGGLFGHDGAVANMYVE